MHPGTVGLRCWRLFQKRHSEALKVLGRPAVGCQGGALIGDPSASHALAPSQNNSSPSTVVHDRGFSSIQVVSAERAGEGAGAQLARRRRLSKAASGQSAAVTGEESHVLIKPPKTMRSAMRAPSIGMDPEQERNPPPSPTPVEFPQYRGVQDNEIQSVTDFNAIYQKLLAIKKPQDITVEHVKSLNMKLETDIEGTQILSDEHFQGLPPFVWENLTEELVELEIMGGGFPYPPFSKYDVVRKELLFDNDDAYREVTRMQPRPGRNRYWDTSLDEYYDKPVTASEEKTLRQQQQQQGGIPMDTGDEEVKTYKRAYKGRRVGTGSEMPVDIRDDTMRGLLEMVAWPFQCQASVPAQQPRLNVQKLLFPVRHTLVAGRVPQDRQAARSGILEGPMLGVQCREETAFRDPEETPGYGQKEMCDIFREVGAMLLLAQERSREGTVEVKPGEGKWWTTVPRWGGAPDDGVTGDAADEGSASTTINLEKQSRDKPQDGDDSNSNMYKRSRYSYPLRSARRSGRSRKLTVSERWKIIEPGPSLWDKRTKYMQIGKPRGSLYDDIFLLSQLNHHVSILHLRVHRRYIDSLTNGSSSSSNENEDDPEQPWNVLKLRRSKCNYSRARI
ncbi:hypothetical protein UA08_04433 [Talaromyces atroroseus]|uniref:Uncharacterized protein n=1 Tax=Talaromyces atroroseus TaxID=1441469 RepID=A0A1Q5Q9D8_TALAT|nr:hypothetical protein UA08_04433 [Talaromyces atroroseus]OKL60725.1 hypothetical protein UA08_04433 [Talaromyces atroroseus]